MTSNESSGRPRKVSRYSLDPSTSSLVLVREFIRATLEPFKGLEPHVPDIVSATHEAAKNAVVHNPETEAPIEVECRVMWDSVIVEVTDRGNGFDDGHLPPPEPDPMSIAGRGMLMIYNLMDDVEARTGKGGTRITMRKRFALG